MFWEHHLFMRASERGMMFLMLNYNPAENGPFRNSDYLLKSWFSGPAFRCETSRFLIIARFWTLVIFLRQAPRKHFFCFVFSSFYASVIPHKNRSLGSEWNKDHHSTHKRFVLSATEKNTISVSERQSDRGHTPCQLLYGNAFYSDPLRNQRGKDLKKPGIKKKKKKNLLVA